MPSRIYWDSCCFIGLLQQEEDKVAALTDLCQKAVKSDVIIVTSALAIVEVCKLPDIGLQPEDQAQKILAFFENPYVAVRSLDRTIAERANMIARQQGIKPPDAIHLATGIMTSCDVFYTYDSKKGKNKGLLKHNGMTWVQPMRIEQPPDPAKGTLFDKPSQ